MRLLDFDYTLPKALIARYPLNTRDASRMMVLDRKKKTITHKYFKDLSLYIKEKDTIIFNNSRVIPARIILKRETGGKAEIFLLKKVGQNLYEALVRPASKLFAGKKLISENGRVVAEIAEKKDVGRLIKFAQGIDIEKDLKKLGSIPLPPYIKRLPEPADEIRYQTVYAKEEGSTASPTAGLHFTEEMLNKIREKKAGLSYVTLHIGYGTFAPVKVENIEKHRMHEEFYELPGQTQDLVLRAKKNKNKVFAVGTSSSRVLESNARTILDKKSQKRSIKNSTDLFIYPGFKFKIVDALLTNFHLPKSTLLMLVSAFCGREFILKAYKEAINEEYRFYSYGDCMLIT